MFTYGELIQSSLEECTTRVKRKRDEAEDVTHELCRALCKAGIPMNSVDGPLGDFICNRCTAARTVPSADALCKKYVPEVYAKKIDDICLLLDKHPISVTVDETPDLRRRPAVGVLVTFFDRMCFRRRTLMVDLQILQKCNTVSIAVVLQAAMEKIGKGWNDVCMLCTDSASYMHKLHSDMQASITKFRALHLKDPCHLLTMCSLKD